MDNIKEFALSSLGGLGVLIIGAGVMTVLGWFPVPSLLHSITLFAVGFLLIGCALAVLFLIALAGSIAERRGG